MTNVPNLWVNLTACKLRSQVPSALRPPAPGYLERWTPMTRTRGIEPHGFALREVALGSEQVGTLLHFLERASDSPVHAAVRRGGGALLEGAAEGVSKMRPFSAFLIVQPSP